MVDVSTQCSEGSPSYSDGTRHSVVHGCIKHLPGWTLECIVRVRSMDTSREKTSHQRARVGSHTESHTPLAENAYRSLSPGCVRQLKRSVLHLQAGRNTFNTVVHTDQETTPRVSDQPDTSPGD